MKIARKNFQQQIVDHGQNKKDKRSEYNTQHVGMNYSMGVATTNGLGVGSYWPPHHTHTHTSFWPPKNYLTSLARS